MYHVYRALASNGIENARFSEVGSFESDKDFQGFGLITEDGTNDIYMIGLWSPSEGVTFADYAYLYQLNTETWTIGEALQQIHMVSVGGMAGMMGVHFPLWRKCICCRRWYANFIRYRAELGFGQLFGNK